MNEVKDSIARIIKTGQAPIDEQGRTALDRTLPLLTDKQKTELEEKWFEANLTYKTQGDFDQISTAKARDRLAESIPTANSDHYAARWRVYDRAKKRLDAYQRVRNTDPVYSVSRHPEVEATESVIKGNQSITPTKAGELRIDSRLAAQDKVEIPKSEQRVLSNQEVHDLLQLPPHPTDDDITKAMPEISKRAHQLYGKYAEQAAREAVRRGIPGQSAREWAETLVEDIDKPAPPQKSQGWFSSGPSKGPSSEEIAFARSHPEVQTTFDKEYGPGAFARIMEQELRKQ